MNNKQWSLHRVVACNHGGFTKLSDFSFIATKKHLFKVNLNFPYLETFQQHEELQVLHLFLVFPQKADGLYDDVGRAVSEQEYENAESLL